MTVRVFSLAIILLGVLIGHAANAQVSPNESRCDNFSSVAKSAVSSDTVPIIPAVLLDSKDALFCLVRAIEALKPRINSDVFEPDVRRIFMSVSAALRVMISKAADTDKLNKNNLALKKFIADFRSLDSLDVTWVLAYGVRNKDPDIRLNSLLILANVIDNSTLCIPLDHLFDPSLGTTDHGKKGRANLLSVISVVAPWAYQENFHNISEASNYVDDQTRGKDEFSGTNAIIANVKARLAVQDNTTNKNVHVPDDEGKACKRYPLRWGQGHLSF